MAIKLSVTDRVNAISLEEKQAIKEAANKIAGKLQPDAQALRYLFEMFNKHIHEYDNKCGECRKHVRDFWINVSSKW
jgi:ferredoxin-thioredoxin reductase catalytic subunit